jgi:hypothetical protein
MRFIYKKDSFKLNNELLLAMVEKDGMLLGAIMQMGFANDDISSSLEKKAIEQNPLAIIFVDEENFKKYLPHTVMWSSYEEGNCKKYLECYHEALKKSKKKYYDDSTDKEEEKVSQSELIKLDYSYSGYDCFYHLDSYFLLPKSAKPDELENLEKKINKIKERLTEIDTYNKTSEEAVLKRLSDGATHENPDVVKKCLDSLQYFLIQKEIERRVRKEGYER